MRTLGGRTFMAEIVSQITASDADVVLHGGDMVEGRPGPDVARQWCRLDLRAVRDPRVTGTATITSDRRIRERTGFLREGNQ